MALILIADDDQATRETLASLLSTQGHETHVAATGHDLLDLAQTYPNFDLVLTDLKMPVLDGVQVLEVLRTRNPRAQVVVMSAYSTPETVIAAVRRGAADYLHKPFDWRELQDVLSRVLGRIPTPPAL